MAAAVQASEAADRLREIIQPGDMVWAVSHGYTRDGKDRLSLRGAHKDTTALGVDLTHLVAAVTGVRLVQSAPYLGLRLGTSLSGLLDRLSVALFGEPDQIRGEYL
jgi:hypothetical protein